MLAKFKCMISYFSFAEFLLWLGSIFLISLAFFLFDCENYLTFIASLIGATSLIYSAKGNAVGQLLMVVFSILYGIISYSYAYYGEMITYLGMTGPMALFSLIAWMKNPYRGNRSEVEINHIKVREISLLCVLTALITILFYYMLTAFGTANIILSTFSVTTSFVAVYLTFRRSKFYAIAYSLNDIILIALWILATIENPQYISVVVCFSMFLLNDLYGFINWSRMQKRQQNKCK